MNLQTSLEPVFTAKKAPVLLLKTQYLKVLSIQMEVAPAGQEYHVLNVLG